MNYFKQQRKNRDKAVFIIGLLVGLLAGKLCFGQPAADVRSVIADLKANVPANQWKYTRYVSLYNRPEKLLDNDTAAFSFVINSLSHAKKSYKITRSGRLLRFNLLQFGIDPKLWDILISDGEPYYHLTSEVLDPNTGKKKKVITDGGWVGLKEAALLRTMTGSIGAVCRADWAIVKLSEEKHYYAIAGIPKKLNDFYKLLGADDKVIEKLGANRGANMFYSGVTRNVRRLSRWQGPLGGVWNTYDVINSKAAKDLIRNPTFTAKYDASEHIAAKANGLHWYAIYNGKGVRQDTVPDKIAKDDSDPHGDGILRPMISCVRCHGATGLKSFTNDQKKLLDANIKLFAKDPKLIDQLDAFYNSTKLDRDLKRDREDFAEAVKQCTGMEYRNLSAALSSVYGSYRNQLVDQKAAIAELGIKSADCLNNAKDPVLLFLAVGGKVQRDQFEDSFQEAALLAAGVIKK